LIPSTIRWIPPCNLIQDERLVAVVVKRPPLGVEDAIERIARHERHVVLTPPPRRGPEIVKHEGSSNDGWSAIKGEAIGGVDVGAPSQFVALLEQVNRMPARGQPYRSAQPAESATNNGNSCHLAPLLLYLYL